MDEESKIFLAQLEEENGGKLEFRTYTTYLGKGGGEIINLGGLFYIVEDKLIFEDFEKQGGPLQLFFRKKGKYEKFKFSINLSDIDRIDLVNLSLATSAVSRSNKPEALPAVSGLKKILFRNLSQILLNDRSTYYFEIFNLKEFNAFISGKFSASGE